MKNISLIFPGQGAQTVGMGKEFYDTSVEAKAIFDQAQQIVGSDFLDVIFNGPEDKLKLTSYCQPAIVAFSCAALAALKADPRYKEMNVHFTAGLSLGEYSALIASGAFSFEQGIRLVQQRGAAMDEACKARQGAMAAVIGFSAQGGSTSDADKEQLKALCAQSGVEVANFNSSSQIVISGEEEKIKKACDLIIQAGAKSVVPLSVAGAFHSSLMQPAADKFKNALDAAKIQDLSIPIVSNVDALAQTSGNVIRENLYKQITLSVLWEDSIKLIASQGVTTFLEIGPGRVLKGLMRKIDSSLNVYNIQTPDDIKNLWDLLSS